MDQKVYEFISKQTQDPIVERKTCAITGKPFAIFQSDINFYDKISPTFDGEKYLLPAPTLCPEEREARRFSRRNESKLYRRTCDKTGESIIAIYPAKSPYTVYDRKVRYSDQWDAMDYGRDYDFSKTFFENFDALNLAVPKKSLHTVDSMENCHYCNYGINSKNCYLCMGACLAENCLYGSVPVQSMYDVDGTFCLACQHTYQCAHCTNCFECAYCDNSTNSKFSQFLSFCNNCENCLGCVNLQTARYCILNKQYTKEEYESMAKEILKDRTSIAAFKEKFEELTRMSPRSSVFNIGSEDCFGNYMQGCKNDILCYLNLQSFDDRYGMGGGYGSNNIFDGYAYTQSSYSMEISGFSWHKSAFILTGEYGCSECYYCQHINACENCFWCIGIKNKKYCILNKQYTKEEYEQRVWKIITQMIVDKERGEFFPVTSSTFAYNETIGQQYRPIAQDEATKRWWRRQEEEYFINIPEGMEKIQGKDLPLTIWEVGDDILNKVIICQKSGKPYRIIQQELDFYRKHNIPLSTTHQDVRQEEVLKKRMPMGFYIITCPHCNQETLSSYPENSWYTVRCPACYNKEVYG